MTGQNKIYHYLNEKEDIEKNIIGKKITLVGGCFDILHYGHLTFLKKARQDGEILVVALESDEFIRQKKRKIPIHTQEQRAEILSHVDLIDAIVLLPLLKTDKEYSDMVSFIHPASIVVTKGDPYRAQKEKQAAMFGARLLEVDSVAGFSSSAIKDYAALSSD